METVLISKSIHINAPAEVVWDMLTIDNYVRIWYAEFSSGSHAETDWQEGSKVIFTDGTGSGLIGRIIANEPNRLLNIEYTGTLTNGKEDYTGEEAELVKGGHEVYRLSEQDRTTHLSIECDMAENMSEYMSNAWDKALQVLKDLAEGKL